MYQNKQLCNEENVFENPSTKCQPFHSGLNVTNILSSRWCFFIIFVLDHVPGAVLFIARKNCTFWKELQILKHSFINTTKSDRIYFHYDVQYDHGLILTEDT